MDYRIIADSCCDVTPELKEKWNVETVPLTLRLGDTELVDDDTLDLPGFMAKMKACTKKIGSAAPSPLLFQEAFEKAKNAFAVTISSQLSGTYQSAVNGARAALEAGAQFVHVFDTKSACAAEVLVSGKVRELLYQNLKPEAIIEKAEKFIGEMKTYFVLERYDNLLKNGRLSRITERIVSILGIRLIMGADGNGGIALYRKARGEKQVLEKMLTLIKESGKATKDAVMVISHCNNIAMAQKLCDAVKSRFEFREIHVVPTGGLSSLYADDHGVVMAF